MVRMGESFTVGAKRTQKIFASKALNLSQGSLQRGDGLPAITQPVSYGARVSTAQCSPLGFKQIPVELVLVTKG